MISPFAYASLSGKSEYALNSKIMTRYCKVINIYECWWPVILLIRYASFSPKVLAALLCLLLGGYLKWRVIPLFFMTVYPFLLMIALGGMSCWLVATVVSL